VCVCGVSLATIRRRALFLIASYYTLVRAATGPELKIRAGADMTAGELAAATTSGAGLAKEQSKVFDPGGGL
jgi:hypothetical protein